MSNDYDRFRSRIRSFSPLLHLCISSKRVVINTKKKCTIDSKFLNLIANPHFL
uniref:Uncharacterized protein n=1 Tax=Ascaris lumbricoides TaxID=6252 RepID=A0A0M3ILY4_ASCLU